MDGDRAVALAAQPGNTSNPLTQVFEGIPFGVLFLDARGGVTFANSAARRMLTARGCIRLRHATLDAPAPRNAARLRRFISRAVTPAKTVVASCIGMVVASRRGVVEIVAVPLTGAEDVAAVLLLFDGGNNLRVNSGSLSQLFGLTRAESLLAGLLVSGFTVAAAARELDISILTARTHLKRALAKTGSSRQAELVHRIGTGPASLNLDVNWL